MLSVDPMVHISMLHRGYYAYIGVESSAKVEMLKSCDLLLAEEKIYKEPYALAFQNNSVYPEIFNKE